MKGKSEGSVKRSSREQQIFEGEDERDLREEEEEEEWEDGNDERIGIWGKRKDEMDG